MWLIWEMWDYMTFRYYDPDYGRFTQIDPIGSDADYQQLFQQVERTTGGRHFYNPVAAALA